MPAVPIVPGDTFRVDQNNLLCLPARWTTVVRFFVLNYVAHAVTIWSRPGEATSEKIFAIVLAFFFPVSGLGRGLDAIYRHASYHSRGGFLKGLFGFGSNEYEIHKAARAGALGVLVREQIGEGTDPWEARAHASKACFALNDEDWEGVMLRCIKKEEGGILSFANRNPIYWITMEDDHKIEKSRELRYTRDISGQASQRKLSGYRLIELPSWLAKHIRLPVKDETKLQIPQNSSLLTALIAICQISYAAYELLRVTGDQFERFGYSAFSLTVVPYLVMSSVNLIGNLATPVYPSIHMISTSTLREAQLRKNVFTGAIGSIEDSHIHNRRANSLEPAEVAIIPYSCAERREWRSQHQSQEATPLRSRDNLSRNQTALRVCFNGDCRDKDNHKGSLEVPYGIPSRRRSTFWETVFKSGAITLAVAAHVAPIVYVGLNYSQPNGTDRKIILPLWIAMGDAIGFYLLWHGTPSYSLRSAQFWLQYRLCCGCGLSSKQRQLAKSSNHPIVWLCVVSAGITIGVWNFYIVAVQILAFGNCINVSDSV